MIAHILCPGPSLSQYQPQDVLRIGVNRAVFHCQCEWWSVSDYPVLQKYGKDVDYPIKVFTNEANAFVIPQRVPECIECLTKEIVGMTYPFQPSGWSVFTMHSAIVLAAYLGATDIRVYGCDWAGVNDFDGHGYERLIGNEAWRTRTPENFEKQRVIYEAVREELAAKGVSVERVNGSA